MKPIFNLALRILVLSVPVVWITPKLDLAFRYLQVLLVLHRHPTDDLMKALFYGSAPRLLPFLLLVLATPKLSLKRRAIGIVLLVTLYFFMDLIMACVWRVSPFELPEPSTAHVASTAIWQTLSRWVLPYLFWLVMARTQINAILVHEKRLPNQYVF